MKLCKYIFLFIPDICLIFLTYCFFFGYQKLHIDSLNLIVFAGLGIISTERMINLYKKFKNGQIKTIVFVYSFVLRSLFTISVFYMIIRNYAQEQIVTNLFSIKKWKTQQHNECVYSFILDTLCNIVAMKFISYSNDTTSYFSYYFFRRNIKTNKWIKTNTFI